MEVPLLLPMRRADLPAVERIAERAFGLAQPLGDMRAELERSFSIQRVLRAGSGQPVAGFVIYWILADEAQIIHVAVAPECQGRGFGQALMRDAIGVARAKGCRTMVLEVRRSNAPAQALYERLGFERIGVRPRYYSDNGEDALVLQLALQRGS